MKLDVDEGLFIEWLNLYEDHKGKHKRDICRMCGEEIAFCRCLENLAEDILETRGE